MKQIKNKYFGILLLAALVFSLQSCLKNNKFYEDFSKGGASAELPLAATYTNKPYGISWSPDTTTEFKVYVNVASVDLPSSPVTMTLGIDQAWVDQYNADQTAAAQQAQQDYLADTSHHTSDPSYPYSWTPMEVMPDSLYTVSSLDLTVPAGQREAYADVTVKSNKFAPGHNYVLPFTIVKSSINISNWNHLPLWFISSPFAGTYNNYHTNITKLGALLYDGDDVMTLSTVDQHTVAQSGSIGDYFGGYTEYHFNGDGSISVKAGGSPSSPNSYGAVVVSSSSDATTGDFAVKFTILGGKYVFTETFNR
jgi:hypothetical protein